MTDSSGSISIPINCFSRSDFKRGNHGTYPHHRCLRADQSRRLRSGGGHPFRLRDGIQSLAPDVIREVRILLDRETGEEHANDLEPFFAAGLLERIEPHTDLEFELLIDYAALLGAGDGEAMCFALA